MLLVCHYIMDVIDGAQLAQISLGNGLVDIIKAMAMKL